MSVSSAEVWKQRLCLFFFSAVGYMLFLHSHHVTDLRLAESCVICRLYSGRTEALSCSEFHGEIHGDCSLPVPVPCKHIHWSMGRWCLRDEDSKYGLNHREQRTGSRASEEAARPDQCSSSLSEMALMEPRLTLSMLLLRVAFSSPPSISTSEVLG